VFKIILFGRSHDLSFFLLLLIRLSPPKPAQGGPGGGLSVLHIESRRQAGSLHHLFNSVSTVYPGYEFPCGAVHPHGNFLAMCGSRRVLDSTRFAAVIA